MIESQKSEGLNRFNLDDYDNEDDNDNLMVFNYLGSNVGILISGDFHAGSFDDDDDKIIM